VYLSHKKAPDSKQRWFHPDALVDVYKVSPWKTQSTTFCVVLGSDSPLLWVCWLTSMS
jgi:hypothetical protein